MTLLDSPPLDPSLDPPTPQGTQQATQLATPPHPETLLAPAAPTLVAPHARPVFDVAVLGLGYVGLPTLLGQDAAGRRVVGVDNSTDRVQAIQSGRVDLVPADRDLLAAALGDDRVVLGSDPALLSTASCVVICVPTPVDEFLVPDLSILRAACATVVEHARPGQLVLLTSTTYVGSTMDLLVQPLAERGLVAGSDVFVAFSPERIDPGSVGHTHQDVPRVVGGATLECTRRAVEVLSSGARVVHEVSSPEAAELTKLLENTFRAVNIALVNEFAEAASELSLDVMEVVRAASTKPYGFMPFTPGPGVGGHCIPCDPHYLLWQLRGRRLTMPVVEQAMAGIAARPVRVVARAREALSQAGLALTGARVLLVGMTYKPDVEDLRESPALEIAHLLRLAGAEVTYLDALVPSIVLPDGHVLTGSTDPDLAATDLVLVHTLHGALDLARLDPAPLVLDATYRLPARPGLVRL